MWWGGWYLGLAHVLICIDEWMSIRPAQRSGAVSFGMDSLSNATASKARVHHCHYLTCRIHGPTFRAGAGWAACVPRSVPPQ